MTDLFEAYTRARSTDPITSHQAAEAIAPKISEIQRRVLRFLTLYPAGLTDWEMEEISNDHSSTIRTRRAELVEMGLVRTAGTRKIKGRNRIVWKLSHQDTSRVPF
jgi:predicted ArsR family transcriptional regulator